MASLSLTDFELDALKETANIGTGSASIALSALLKQKVQIDLPKTDVVPVKQVLGQIAGKNEAVVGIYAKVKTGLKGNILLIFPAGSAYQLISQITEKTYDSSTVLDKEDRAMLGKLGSVLCAAYLNSLSKFFEQRIVYGQPNIISTIGSAMADFMLVQINEKEKVLLIKVGFTTEKADISGNFVLAFTLSSLSPLLDSLRKKLGVEQ